MLDKYFLTAISCTMYGCMIILYFVQIPSFRCFSDRCSAPKIIEQFQFTRSNGEIRKKMIIFAEI